MRVCVEVLKEPKTETLWARLGKYRYSKLLFYIAKQNQPIDRAVLMVKVLQKALGNVPLPLNHLINRDYRRILGTCYKYEEKGYLRFSISQSRKDEEDLIFLLWRLHRYLRHKGQLPLESWQGYKFKILDFKDLVNGAILPVFVIVDHLVVPNTKTNLMTKTGYTERTIRQVFVALRYLGLLSRQGNRYTLKGDKEKILELMKTGLECKQYWIKRIQKFLTARQLFAQNLSVRKVAQRIDCSEHTVGGWRYLNKRPLLKFQTVQLFLVQKLITESEFSAWQKEGILFAA